MERRELVTLTFVPNVGAKVSPRRRAAAVKPAVS